MVHDVIATCPVCSGELTITRLQCRGCGTALEGEFGAGRFGRLDREQLGLLESFLRARGNLKEVERELRISYPTVRARVDALVRALGFGDQPDAPGEEPMEPDQLPDTDAVDDLEAQRRSVLERLARRELSAEDAAAALRAIGERG